MDINFDGISELILSLLGKFGQIDFKSLNTDILPQLANYIRPIVVYFLGFLG